MIPRHTARGIIIHNDKILLIERFRRNKHYFSIPGGGVESDETAEQACARELDEETGCEITVGRELYRLETADGSGHIIFLCTYVSGEPHLHPDSPEALTNDPDNRFNPVWLPLADLEAAPMLVWDPVRLQLLKDLQTGFSQNMIDLTGNVIP